jgi:hypothetical protein
MVFLLVWPAGSPKAQMMLATAVVGVIVAFGKLIAPHSHDDGFTVKLIKRAFALILKVLRGSTVNGAGEVSHHQ